MARNRAIERLKKTFIETETEIDANKTGYREEETGSIIGETYSQHTERHWNTEHI